MSPKFEWDVAKATSNLLKHGISFEEASTVFANPLALIFDDQEHSDEEKREIIIGHTSTAVLLVISFTARESGIRIISARKATKIERNDYEANF
jgi:uncharacterized protein